MFAGIGQICAFILCLGTRRFASYLSHSSATGPKASGYDASQYRWLLVVLGSLLPTRQADADHQLQHQVCVAAQVHHVTRQIEYHGELMSLTEAIVGFPVGGQVLISGSTYQRIYGRLHTIGPLTPITPPQGRSALGRSRSRRLSTQPREGWKGMLHFIIRFWLHGKTR